MLLGSLHWRYLGPENAELGSAMIAEDGETMGALVSGRPVIVDRSGAAIALPREIGQGTFTAAALSPDGQRLALASATLLQTLDLSSGRVYTASLPPVHQLLWRHDGHVLAAGHAENKVSLCTPEAECTTSIALPVRMQNWQVAFGSSEETIFAACSEGLANWLCRYRPGEAVRKLKLASNRYLTGLTRWNDGVLVALSDGSYKFELVAYSADRGIVSQVLLTAPVTSVFMVGDHLGAGTTNGNVWLSGPPLDDPRVRSERTLWSSPVLTTATAQDCFVAGADDGRLALIDIEQ